MTDPSFIRHRDISVEIIRSPRRKTMALQIQNGAAIIRMPKCIARQHAEAFVIEKYDWIKQSLSKHPIQTKKMFADGESLLFIGEPLTLATVQASQNRILKDSNMLIIESQHASLDHEQKRKKLEKWYRQQALHYLTSRCEVLSKHYQLYPKKLSIRSYKARWGSCNLRGEVQLNWKLIMAPPAVIDYVIIHELCHLKQHNHSPAFWSLVSEFEPNYKRYRLWLKQNGYSLNL